MRRETKIFALSLWLVASAALASPHFSIQTGKKCVSCHESSFGGGQRSELGAYVSGDVSMTGPKSGESETWDKIKNANSFFDGAALWGFDFRYLSFRPGGPFLGERKYFVMQAEPYLSLRLLEYLKLGAAYNFAEIPLAGQSRESFWAILAPDLILPQLKMGFYRPLPGAGFEDHSIFTNRIAGQGSRYIVAPGVSDFGAEIIYEGLKFLTASAGYFATKNISASTEALIGGAKQSIIGESDGAFLFRIRLIDKMFADKVNAGAGASLYLSGDYSYYSVFAGAGLTDFIDILTEYSVTDKRGVRLTNNYAIEINYKVYEPLRLYARAEKAETEESILDILHEQSGYLFGAKAYLTPFVAVAPEYRVFVNPKYESYAAQYAVQLHIFY